MDAQSLRRYGQWVVWYLVGLMVVFGLMAFYLLPDDLYIQVADILHFPELLRQVFHHASLLPFNDTLHRFIGVILLILGLFQFNPKLRHERPALHRWSGRLFLVLGLVTITSGLIFAFDDPFSGLQQQVFIVSVSVSLISMLSRAVSLAIRRDFAHHREWMLRVYALFLFVAMQRILIVSFALVTDWPERDIFIFTGWISAILMLIAAETWINLSRRSAVVTTRVS